MDGSEFKELRGQLRLTQAQLGEELEKDRTTVGRWERGKRPIPDSVAAKLRDLARRGPGAEAARVGTSVILDKLHEEILAGLNQHIDADAFEQCAADLLSTVVPALVPVRGGGDGGFDGAFPSDGSSCPLVTTTSVDAEGNLEKSLSTVAASESCPRAAVFATSRRVLPGTRRRLEAIAKSKGIRLQQVFDQDWFASALYRNDTWRKKLLGISGRPAALSVFPRTSRPTIGTEVVGRSLELDQLRAQDGDCLLIGEPGSGKTFLLRTLALNGDALFLVDGDREALADALRSQHPDAIIVDDAHLDDGGLPELVQLRTQLGLDFRIIAVTWPTESKSLASRLRIPSGKQIRLELLDRDTIVEVVKSAGLKGPDSVLYAIQRQAEGRPGLAVTLAQLCLNGGVREVLSGDALLDDLALSIGQLVGPDSLPLLAVLSLGGPYGCSTRVAATGLEMRLHKADTLLARLAAAGIIRPQPNGAIAVSPEPLRFGFVRRFFFEGVGSLDYRELLGQMPSKEGAVHSLLGAARQGARIPDLLDVLRALDDSTLWVQFSWLGPDEAALVLRTKPELAPKAAEPALYHVPDAVIPLLLSAASEDNRALHSHPDHPLRRIQDWATGDPRREDPGDRRTLLLRASLRWVADGGTPDVGLPRSRNSSLAPLRLHVDRPGKRLEGHLHEWDTRHGPTGEAWGAVAQPSRRARRMRLNPVGCDY